jgi:hypothetical protein
MVIVIGRRIYPDEKGNLLLKPGDYGKSKNGIWVARTPNGITDTLPDHKITEHEDGTITVSQSIILYPDCERRATYHGFLEKGVWREV